MTKIDEVNTVEEVIERNSRGVHIKFIHEDDSITIIRPDRNEIMFTTYIKEAWDEITKQSWSLNKAGYPVCSRLGSLHRYIMEKWYGV